MTIKYKNNCQEDIKLDNKFRFKNIAISNPCGIIGTFFTEQNDGSLSITTKPTNNLSTENNNLFLLKIIDITETSDNYLYLSCQIFNNNGDVLTWNIYNEFHMLSFKPIFKPTNLSQVIILKVSNHFNKVNALQYKDIGKIYMPILNDKDKITECNIIDGFIVANNINNTCTCTCNFNIIFM